MTRCHCRSMYVLAISSILALSAGLFAQSASAPNSDLPDLTDYKTVEQATTARISNAMPTGAVVAGYLGVHAVPNADGKLTIAQIENDSPAASVGLREGDILVSLAERPIANTDVLREVLKSKAAGDEISLSIIRDKAPMQIAVKLAPTSKIAPTASQEKGGGWDTRGGGKGWKKGSYKLAIIGIDYADMKHNPKITNKHWEDSLFSVGTYNKTNATGQKVHGSMKDYYLEQSFQKLTIDGKMFDHVEVSKKRMDYAAQGVNKTVLFNEVFAKLLEREGKDALNGYDGVFFLFSGKRPQVPRGSIYWPHRSSYKTDSKSWPYFIVEEGGDTMQNISVFCHEFGHMLGLPDLYARPENPGSTGVWQWCAMSNQVGGGRPQHFCAWSKEQVGWVTPCVIDPTVKQKLILAPIEDSPKECFKVLIRPDGSEYLLLENRKKKGYDSSLPGEGLLIWRVIGNRPVLEESHGITGPAGPRVFPTSIPFPSPSNDAFTPYTIPSSRSQLGGGLPVHITNIRRLADGRITFQIGYEYL